MTDKSINPSQELQEEVLKTIRESQEAVIDAIKTWVDTVQSIPTGTVSVQMPFVDKPPTAEDAVASAYDFADQVLKSQRQFAEEVMKATSPLLPGSGWSTAAGGPLPGPGSGGGGPRPKPKPDPK